VLEAFENGPAFDAGFDRGVELLAIGTNGSNLESVGALLASGGVGAVVNALGPSDPGVTRTLRFARPDGTVITATVTKEEFALDPISDRYGARIISDGSRTVGYVNLRTFIIADAADQLREAFALFNANDVTELVLDFRYNGGGLVSVAETLGDLLGKGLEGQVFSETILRPEKSEFNDTALFRAEPNALRPEKIAFITTDASASASELVVNAMLPYFEPEDIAIIGQNTSGKPVGQFAFDLEECDLRIRAVTFRTVNANGNGEYFNGLADVVPNTCRADDDFTRQLGDPAEDSLATALSFLRGESCTPIASSITAQSVRGRKMLTPANRSAAQWQIPGLF
jgi:C-terminal processing protease CtpA/Prc